jgi:hypothetical protein
LGQQAKPSSHGESVPVMQSQPAVRHGPGAQSPSLPQCPEQQSRQFFPQEQAGGQTTLSLLQSPPKHWLGGTQVPEPPGRFGSSAQQTSPGVQLSGAPV